MSPDEKRCDRRFPLVLVVEFRDGGCLRDYTENLSAGGLFVRTERPFSVGDRTVLVLSFPGLLERAELEVEVLRRRDAGPHGPAGVALAVPADSPASRRRLEELARAASRAAQGPEPYRMLLVEDNTLVAAMYGSALRRLSSQGGPGLTIEFASDGQEALDRLRQVPRIDLVVTDIYLPVMSGLELLESIRADPELAGMTVVVITAGSGEERARAARLGAEVFLQKPVRSQDIVGTIRALLSGQKRHARPGPGSSA